MIKCILISFLLCITFSQMGKGLLVYICEYMYLKAIQNDIILYTISLICIILLLIEWIFISHKKCSINAIVFVGYSFPLYYLMIYKGAGGAAFTWWFYLVLFTSIHVIILLIILFYFFISRRRANERKQRCDK